jgi:glycosyltransferase involved in cell wall biosynthesis
LNSTPRVTVIMPIRNEAAFITRSLGAVLNQTYPRHLTEIVIADGMSDDGTPDIIRAVPGAHDVIIVPNPQRRQAAGLNLAIQRASGEVIVRVDGHTVIAEDYIAQCVAALIESGAQNVGGPMHPVGVTPMGRAIAAAGKSAFAVPTAFHVSERAQFTDTVYLGAWWKTTFDQIGLFDETAPPNEDYDLNYRIRAAGGKVYLTPRIQSVYYGRQTLPALVRQYFNYGIGKVKTLRRHPASLRLRHLVAPAFVAALIVGAVGALLHPLLAVGWLAMLGLYAAANLFFSARAARGAEAGVLIRLPIVFFAIHLAWGAGFWFALLTGRR